MSIFWSPASGIVSAIPLWILEIPVFVALSLEAATLPSFFAVDKENQPIKMTSNISARVKIFYSANNPCI